MGRTAQISLAAAGPNQPQGFDGSLAEQLPIMMVQDRIVFLSGDVTEHTITNVQAQLISLANISSAPIKLIVSTYGGSVDEMFSLYDTLKLIKTPVYTVALGKVMSAGVLLLAAGDKGHRTIGRHARIMIHPVSGGSGGTVFQLENDSKENIRLHNLMVNALISETKMKKAEIEKIMKIGYDYYITADEAVRLGIVDSIV